MSVCGLAHSLGIPTGVIYRHVRYLTREDASVRDTPGRAVVGVIVSFVVKLDGHVPAPVGRRPGSSWCTG